MSLFLIVQLALHLMVSSPHCQADEYSCESRGGVRKDASCYCEETRSFFSPYEAYCVERMVSRLVAGFDGRLSLPQDEACDYDRELASLGKKTKPCDNPARAFCSPARNPSVSHSLELRRQLDTMEAQFENDPKIQEYLKARKKQACYELSVEEYETCHKLRQELSSARLYTAPVKARAAEAFESARREILSLASRLSGTSEKTLKELREAKLTVGRTTQGTLVSTNHVQAGVVHLGRSALLAATAPEELEFTLLHELGHLLFRDYPKALAACLGSPESVAAQASDRACLKRASLATRVSHPEFSYKLLQADTYYDTLPHFDWTPDDWPEDVPNCQHSQHMEAYADFIAAEAFGPRLARLPKADQLRAAQGFVAGRCRAYLEELENPPVPLDGHPAEEARINRIVLAHPAIRAAFGCSSDGRSSPHYCGGERK
ncbi:MAG: hypothetical protein NDJ89_06650 [Oligoflexia bacterium]|nr:hypothetical protein [Oligoflexia bacterium]